LYLEKLKLDERVAVITGGGQGIGAACAQALGEAGASVVVAEILPERLEAVVDTLRRLGIRADGVVLDVRNSSQVDEVAEHIVSKHGRVDILVNNA
jgi:NAD(P)-dependent dehydrogenase (short-subunit alcohol dehydrogenase family)